MKRAAVIVAFGVLFLSTAAQGGPMTDVSNLDNLAAAIQNSSAKIKAYAQAQAAATQSQETAIQGLLSANQSQEAKINGLLSDMNGVLARVQALEDAQDPSPPPPPPTTSLGWPRTYQINRLVDISDLWKYDWVVGFAFQNVQLYHQRNPTGFAMTYVRLDNPAYNQSQFYPPGTGPDAWTCSNIGYAFQSLSNSLFPGKQEQYSVLAWPGGTDNLSDGQAANAGTMRAWVRGSDDMGTQSCAPQEVTYTFNLANASDLVGRLMLYAAKVDKVYANGWDGVWSDNAYAQGSTAWTDGLVHVMSYLRDSLPAKSVGGNGAWIQWYRTGFSGSDPQGYLKMANANLHEGFEGHWGAISQASADSFIAWTRSCLEYADPKGMARYNAFWDWNGGSSLARMRWSLTLSLMSGMYYAPSNLSQWYDEFWGGTINQRGYLGTPSGPAVKLASGVWRRYFANGVALNNSTRSSQTVSLGGTFRRLTGTQDPSVNNGQTVTSVTIPATDGLILVK
jgi:hypothetical protein